MSIPGNPICTEPKPYCPDCKSAMRLKRPKPGQPWSPFWGCSMFPVCKGVRQIEEDGRPEMVDGLDPYDWRGT